jgi:heme/copper-type cytochrome/quinol oxidase subunit 3
MTMHDAHYSADVTPTRVPGNKGIWAGITCEFVEFTVLFAVYFIARAHFPDAFHKVHNGFQ